MLEKLLTDNFWLVAAIWAGLFCSDYYLTLAAARLYRRGAKEHIVFEGSYELTPYFQKDIDGLRTFSPRFLWGLTMWLLILFISWAMAIPWLGAPWLFSFVTGTLILLEAAVHLRHGRNLAIFRYASRGEGLMTGRIEYSKVLSLKLSAVELIGFAGLFLFVFLLAGHWFFLGGAVSCLATGLKHWRLAGRVPAMAADRLT
jgi:hypothetical protein